MGIEQPGIEKRLRSRILDELHRHQELATHDEYADEVLERTLEAIKGYVGSIADEIKAQEAVLSHKKEDREVRQKLLSDQIATSRLAIDLPQLFFKTDVELMVKHLELIEEPVLRKAFETMNEESVVFILHSLLSALSDKQMDGFVGRLGRDR